MKQDKIVILKPTKSGYKTDTVIINNANDTLSLDVAVDVEGDSYLIIPEKPIEVNTPGKDAWDYWTSGLTLLGALIAAWYTIKLLKGLKDDNKHKQDQIDQLKSQTNELIVQNKILEKRHRLSVKPQLWQNTFGVRSKSEFRFSIDNRGHICFIRNIETVEGDDNVIRTAYKNWPIERDNHMEIVGEITNGKNVRDTTIRLKMLFEDVEGYQYEATILLVGGIRKEFKVVDI
jgi:hypothetical protein